jgi:hypothetical protein
MRSLAAPCVYNVTYGVVLRIRLSPTLLGLDPVEGSESNEFWFRK